MAEALKRWNGSQWVTVTAVNRIEVGGTSTGGDFIEFIFIDDTQIIGVPTAL